VTSAWPISVFGTDDCSAQLTWPASPAEDLEIQVGGSVVRPAASPVAEIVLDEGGSRRPVSQGAHRYFRGRRALDAAWPSGPGSVVVDGLAPATTYDVVASATGVPTFLASRVTTLPSPGGRLLCKFAAVSDVHIGEKHFGVLGRIHDPGENSPGVEPYPVRSLRGAIAEAAAWGAELLVVKGDLTREAVPAEVRDAGRVLASSPLPLEVILGNHDNKWGVDVRGILDSQGVAVSWQPRARDLPGVRLVLMSTAHGDPRYHGGQLPAKTSEQIAALARAGPGPAWVCLHHPPEMFPFPTVYPPGIPFGESRRLLEALARPEQPATFLTCGHRHRNRRYDYRRLVVTEVGSTKDYPGVWAGYKVFEGGIIQLVRRTSDPDVMAWTEATRRAVNGQWRRWSPGRMADRCFTVDWPARATSGADANDARS
jgi:3',5'-cyclic-AMP phosphodiesterase